MTDWRRVRRYATASFSGRGLDQREFDYLRAAWLSDPTRYREETEAARSEVRSAINPLGTFSRIVDDPPMDEDQTLAKLRSLEAMVLGARTGTEPGGEQAAASLQDAVDGGDDYDPALDWGEDDYDPEP